MTEFQFPAIGTHWHIQLYKELTTKEEGEILSRIQERIKEFDTAYSRFRSDSLVTRMSQDPGVFELPSDAERMMALYYDLYTITGGLFTPLVGTMIADAGYDAEYSLVQKKALEASPRWEDSISYEHPYLTVKQPVLLDFGAAGKGYLIDIIGELLESLGIEGYCIDAGGDIRHRGLPIRVGLEDPEDTSRVIGVYSLGKGSLCGSAGNRRAWADFTHIINPVTGVSPRHIAAVWVAADATRVADALATCLFFTDASVLMEEYVFDYCILYSDRSIEKSENFSHEFFTA